MNMLRQDGENDAVRQPCGGEAFDPFRVFLPAEIQEYADRGGQKKNGRGEGDGGEKPIQNQRGPGGSAEAVGQGGKLLQDGQDGALLFPKFRQKLRLQLRRYDATALLLQGKDHVLAQLTSGELQAAPEPTQSATASR